MRKVRRGLLMTAVLGFALSAMGCIIPSHIVEHDRFWGIVQDSQTGVGLAGVTVRTVRIQHQVEHALTTEITDERGEFISDIDYDYGVVWLFWLLTIPPSTPDPTDVALHLSKDGYVPITIWLEGGTWWTADATHGSGYPLVKGNALGEDGRTRTAIYNFDHGRIPYHDVFLYNLPIIRMRKAE